jgi:FAD/FMN-containing dehydrogenase
MVDRQDDHSEMSSGTPLEEATVEEFAASFKGELIRPEDATAEGHRDAAYMVHPITCWQDPADTERHIDWVGRFSEAMRPFTTGGVYLNFEPDEGEEQVRAAYGAEKYARLVALKDKWDPENLFRVNQNIKPSRETHVPTPA